jgi:hypothetical protein
MLVTEIFVSGTYLKSSLPNQNLGGRVYRCVASCRIKVYRSLPKFTEVYRSLPFFILIWLIVIRCKMFDARFLISFRFIDSPKNLIFLDLNAIIASKIQSQAIFANLEAIERGYLQILRK